MNAIRGALGRAVVPTLALVTAFALGGVVIVLTDFEHLQHLGTDPAGALGGAIGGVFDGYRAMFAGAIGDPWRLVAALQSGDQGELIGAIWPISEALVGATPFIFVGLGVAVAFHAGLLNLGADGQFLMGGVGAGVTAALVAGSVPPLFGLVLAVAGGTLFGAAWGFIPGFLKARTGAHEVITTLMLNAIAPGVAVLIGQSGLTFGNLSLIAEVPRLFDLPTLRVDVGFFVGLAMAIAVSYLLFRTTLGFELRSTGFSPRASRSAGMRPGGSVMLAMAISGGLAGMGSALIAFGPGSRGGVGFVALALALIAGLRPSAIVVIALLFGALNNGAKQMVIETRIPLALLEVIVAFAVMLVAAPGLVRAIWRLRAPGTAESPTTRSPGPAHGV